MYPINTCFIDISMYIDAENSIDYKTTLVFIISFPMKNNIGQLIRIIYAKNIILIYLHIHIYSA